MRWMEGFLAPPSEYRPRARYWMPHAVLSERGIARDMRDIASRGFGGVEVVPMSACLEPGFFKRENLWGSDAWIEAMKILLREARANGMTVDFAGGPSWPLADLHAADASAESVIYELAYGLRVLEAGEHYEGGIPMPRPDRETRHQKLLSLAMYRMSGEKTIDISTYTPLPLSMTVSVTAPDDGQYALFSYFEKPSGRQGINSDHFYVIDHFSAKGADAVMDLWKYEILPRFGEDACVIRSIFCDSLEYITNMDWSRGFEQAFKQRKGYDILPYLPCLGHPGSEFAVDRNRCVFPPTDLAGFYLSDMDEFTRVNDDYMDMLNHLYCHEHLGRMQERATKLGLNIRYQVAYNKTLEAEMAAHFVGIPENEPLGRPLLDNFRIMSAAVHLDRKPMYSYESAAEKWNDYGQTHEDILWWVKRSYLGGMNFQVLHGVNYCGYYDGEGNVDGVGPGIKWPGFDGFHNPLWTNSWNRTMSVPQQAYMLRYLARCNYLMQNVHKIDVAVYRHSYSNYCHVGASDGDYIYRDGNALNAAGYTYEFLSPSLMDHPNARAVDGVFDPDGAGYRAIVINGEEYMDFHGAERLLEYNRAGLPVLFVGRKPDKCRFASASHTDAELCALIEQIDGVVVENIQDVPRVLAEQGILPDAMPDTPCNLRSVHLKVEGADVYYLYNTHTVYNVSRPETIYPRIDKRVCMEDIHTQISLLGEGKVYEIDGFDGKVKRLEAKTADGRTALTLDFVRDEAKILAILTDEMAAALGISGELEPTLTHSGTITLDDFTLTVERVKSPDKLSSTFYESVWERLPSVKTDATLPWNKLYDEWNEFCGIASYETSFVLDGVPRRAVLKTEHVCDTYEVYVNGVHFDQGDPALRATDITSALVGGENHIKVVVAGTLKNAVTLEFLRRAAPPDRPRDPQDLGMWGTIAIDCYR